MWEVKKNSEFLSTRHGTLPRKKLFSFGVFFNIYWLCLLLQVFTCLTEDSFCDPSLLFCTALLNSLVSYL